MTSKEIINLFILGRTDAVTGTKSIPGNVKISGNQLIHYRTPILERYNGGYIFNKSSYSFQTEKLQNSIRDIIPEGQLVVVTKVPIDYKRSLIKYL